MASLCWRVRISGGRKGGLMFVIKRDIKHLSAQLFFLPFRVHRQHGVSHRLLRIVSAMEEAICKFVFPMKVKSCHATFSLYKSWGVGSLWFSAFRWWWSLKFSQKFSTAQDASDRLPMGQIIDTPWQTDAKPKQIYIEFPARPLCSVMWRKTHKKSSFRRRQSFPEQKHTKKTIAKEWEKNLIFQVVWVGRNQRFMGELRGAHIRDMLQTHKNDETNWNSSTANIELLAALPF